MYIKKGKNENYNVSIQTYPEQWKLNNWSVNMVVMCIFQFPTGTVDGTRVYQVSNIF